MCLKSFAPRFIKHDTDGSDGFNPQGAISTTSTESWMDNSPKDCLQHEEMILDVRKMLVDQDFTNMSTTNPLTYTPVLVKPSSHVQHNPVEFYKANLASKKTKIAEGDSSFTPKAVTTTSPSAI